MAEDELRDHLKKEYDTQGIGVRFVRSLFPAYPAPRRAALSLSIRAALSLSIRVLPNESYRYMCSFCSFFAHRKEPQKQNGTVSCMRPQALVCEA